MRLRVALDHYFPIPIVRAMSDAVVEAELSPVSEIDSRFVRLDDATLVHALARRGWSAMVTCDANMLALPSVLARILQTRMTVVAALGQGHDPVASTGLVLAHLPHIVARHREDTPQVWRLRVGSCSRTADGLILRPRPTRGRQPASREEGSRESGLPRRGGPTRGCRRAPRAGRSRDSGRPRRGWPRCAAERPSGGA